MRIAGLLVAISLVLVISPQAPAAEKITPDVVYGHKHGLALTFDVFRPDENALACPTRASPFGDNKPHAAGCLRSH